MAATSSTTYSSTIQTIWQRKILNKAKGMLYWDKFADTASIGKGSGNTIRINRLLRIPKATEAATSGTLITPSSAKALTSNYMDLTMQNWGDSFAFNEDVDVLSFISRKENQDEIANQMARTLGY